MPSHDEYLQHVESFFQMTLLETLDPGDPADVPGLIIGAYIATQRGVRQSAAYIDETFIPDSEQCSMASILAEIKAGENLEKVADLVGYSILTVTAIGPDNEAIRKNNFHPVHQARGGVMSLGRPGMPDHERFDGSENDHLMRLTGLLPGDEYTIRVIDDHFEPLVKIEVASGPKTAVEKLSLAVRHILEN